MYLAHHNSPKEASDLVLQLGACHYLCRVWQGLQGCCALVLTHISLLLQRNCSASVFVLL